MSSESAMRAHDLAESFRELDIHNLDEIFMESKEELARRLAALEAAGIVDEETLRMQFTI